MNRMTGIIVVLISYLTGMMIYFSFGKNFLPESALELTLSSICIFGMGFGFGVVFTSKKD